MEGKKNIAKVSIPPVAGYALYKAYKSGTFSDIKEKLFGKEYESPTTNHDMIPPTTYPQSLYSPDTINIVEADTIHGQPAQNVQFDPTVYQYYDDTCAIQSQHLVLQQYGIDVTQEELIAIAKENGWYAEGYGTPKEMVGKLLEYYGIDIQGSEGNNVFNIANELAQGHQIIVGVDAYELIYPEETKDWDEIYGEEANHALVVVGIDTSDPDNVKVIVTDPGTGNRQMAYPADQFVDAWKDSNCFMVTTDGVASGISNPLPPIDNFGSISKDALQRLSGMDIDLSKQDLYDNFVGELLSSSEDLDNLISKYDDLFSLENDSDNNDDFSL